MSKDRIREIADELEDAAAQSEAGGNPRYLRIAVRIAVKGMRRDSLREEEQAKPVRVVPMSVSCEEERPAHIELVAHLTHQIRECLPVLGIQARIHKSDEILSVGERLQTAVTKVENAFFPEGLMAQINARDASPAPSEGVEGPPATVYFVQKTWALTEDASPDSSKHVIRYPDGAVAFVLNETFCAGAVHAGARLYRPVPRPQEPPAPTPQELLKEIVNSLNAAPSEVSAAAWFEIMTGKVAFDQTTCKWAASPAKGDSDV